LPVLEEADEEVTRWAQSVLPGADVALGPPLAESDSPAVSLHLLALTDVPAARGPIVVRGAPLAPLEGLVLGPGDVPISDAFIALPKLSATTRSDRRGRFRFAAVPSDVPTAIVVRAKAGEFPFTVASPPESEPVVLRLALSEG
jgi:hypothetical protein